MRWSVLASQVARMKLFGRLRSLVDPASVEQPPTDVFAALIDDLYAPLASFVIGATASTAVCGVTAWRTGNAWLTVLAVSMVVIAAVRVVITLDYRKHQPTIGGDAAALCRWERWYEIGASVYAACLGGACFVAFAFIDDPVSHLLLHATSVGYTAGATARNSSRPRVAVAQLSLILLPITVGSALRRDTAYAVLSVITLLYYLATIEIVQYLARHRLRLLLTTREKGELAHSLAEQNFRFDTALANMSHGLCMFDAQHRLLVWNKRFCEIYRIAAEVLSPGITVRQMVELSAARGNHPDRTVAEIVAEFEIRLASGIAGYAKRPLPNGRIIALSHQPMPGGGVVVIFDDVTEREEAEARAQFLSTHDELTGLPNRLVFGQAVSDAVKVARRYGQEFAVMFVDLDRFKIINDRLGHAAGDSLLTEVANRLKQCVRESDVVARVGGDEFIILLREVSDARQVTTIARKILSTMVKPLTIHGQECRVTASIGISLFPSDARDEESLTRNADAAMYAAKEEGRNDFRFHSLEIKTQSIERLMLETSLRRALERNELLLYYQPKQDLGHGGIAGVEALLRWRHPDLGLLHSSRFIPLAVETGLIVPIGKWVLETACAQNMAWQRQGLPAIRIAVNLSPRQFADPNLLHDIRGALEKSGMPAQLLELEITESMVMQNVERTVRVLEAIKSLGITLAIDDFGTGYSSMSLVKKFPIDALKIDRSFVREIINDCEDKAIVDAIIALGRALNLTVVAEGVETVEQEAFLRAHNCDEIQGYLISKPVPADEFAAFLANHAVAQLKALAAQATSRGKVLPTGTQG
jgi:diguanylate cyclase (GGDEF)-like protein